MYSNLRLLSLTNFLDDTKKIKKDNQVFKKLEEKDFGKKLNLSKLEKYTIIFDLFDKKKYEKYTQITNDSFFKDLNIFDGNSIFNIIDKTKTIFGEIQLRIIIYIPIDDITILQERQNIIKKLSTINKSIFPLLEEIKKKENDILWLLKKKTDEEIKYIDSVYCTNKWLKWINNYPFLLNLVHYFNVIFTPLSTLISPCISIILAYIALRFVLGIKIGIFKFYKCFKMGFNSSFNFLGKKFEILSQIIYGILYVISIYKAIISAKTRIDICKIIYEKISSINSLLISIDSINVILKNVGIFKYFWNKKLENDLNKMKQKFRKYNSENSFISLFFKNWGEILTTFSQLNQYTNNITNLLEYIGKIDAYISITKIKLQKSVCFTKYIKKKEPLLIVKDILHPYLVNKNPILNDLNLEKFKNILLFGPNASGKSLLIKSVMINVLLSQTLTISYAKSIDITPFSILNTYLNIPDIVGEESLFEAEVHRCKDYITRIKSVDNDKFALTVFDELFSSTNYYEGLSTSYSICKYLSKYSNSINIITTHFDKLSKLEKYGLFKCYKMKITQEKNGKIKFHYKLRVGKSKKKLAIELLRMKGLDKEIVECALNFYNKTFNKKKNLKKEKKKN